MNEAKILTISPSCWSWVNTWKLSWAEGHLRAWPYVGSDQRQRLPSNWLQTGWWLLWYPQHDWCLQASGLRLLGPPFQCARILWAHSSVCMPVSFFRAGMEENKSNKWDKGKAGICPLRYKPPPEVLRGSCWQYFTLRLSALISDIIAFFSALWRFLEKKRVNLLQTTLQH